MDSLVKKKYEKALNLYDNQNFEEAFEIFFNLAKQGILKAQMEVAYMFYEGKGISQDIKQSMYWFKKNLDNIEAIRMLGWCYLKTDRVEEGIIYLNKALKDGNIEAIIDIGSFYDFGDYGFEIDKEKALEYYKMGCIAGVRDGCRHMSLLLQEMDINSIQYIKKNIGYLKFLRIILYGRILKFFSFCFSEK